MEKLTPRKTKILFLITKSNWGGAQRYVYDLATQAPDHTSIAVALGGSGTLKQKLESKGIPTRQIPFLGRDISFFKEVGVFFFLIALFVRERPDVIHVNSSKIGGIGALAGRLTGIKTIIFTAHGFAFNEVWRSWLAKKIIYILSWLTIVLSTKTIVLSKHEYEQARSMPLVNDKKLAHIYLGIRPESPYTREDALQKLQDEHGLKYDSTKPLLGTIAELTTNKGLDFLLRACALLKQKGMDFECVIIGIGEDATKLQNLALREGLGRSVQFLGFVPNASKYLKAFNVFTLTSRKEGLPYTILEAGHAECAVVASRVGGIPEMIDHERSGLLVIVGNIKALAANLEGLLHSPAYQTDFGQNLKQTMEERFNFDIMLEKTYALYALGR